MVLNRNVKVSNCAETTQIEHKSDKTTTVRDRSLFCLYDGELQVLSQLAERTFSRSQYRASIKRNGAYANILNRIKVPQKYLRKFL